MKRFLVIELFSVAVGDVTVEEVVGEEIVHDADTYLEAKNWVMLQKEPNKYLIEDSKEDDGTPSEIEDIRNLNSYRAFDRELEDDEVDHFEYDTDYGDGAYY